STLTKAKNAKADEFYTQLSDIEKELKNYRSQFLDSTVLCNCDDPFESNFFKFFALNFNMLGLKKLIATCFDGSPIAYTQLSLFGEEKKIENTARRAYKIEISEVSDFNKDGAVDLSDVEYLLKNKANTLTLLKGDGDFRSAECVELLKQADIVVTNPPFSLFREYVAQLVEYDKKFLIIGNVNAITYKEIFPLLKENKIWIGYDFNKTMKFQVPDNYKGFYENGIKYGKVPAINWYTNLQTKKRHQELIMYKKYTPEEYPKYINYNAIEVSKITEIPYDYYEAMGVPITFLDKYNPEQFEILGIDGGDMGVSYGIGINLTKVDIKNLFNEHRGFRRGKLCFRDNQGKLQMCYRRVLIKRRRKNEN
ncbi:MAG: adenine-specific methyltransferase EcoRI family protein, partial [Clostridia bacterium]|nr:adenine-specific methyltransferase EcoRI family protein [Clostridia bacterium]